MDWKDAIAKCRLGEKRAIRLDNRGRTMVRFSNGEGFILYQGLVTRIESEKLEGYLDWEPA